MKRLIAIISVLLLLISSMSIAFADEATDTVDDETAVLDDLVDSGVITDGTAVEETEEVVVAPDSPVWGLKRALERINLALTLDKAKKSEKRLRYAHKRLLEVNAMMKKGDLKNAAKAQKYHAKLVSDATEDVDEIEADEGKTERVEEFRSRLSRNIDALEAVKDKLEAKGVSAPGIEIALAIAKAKSECRQEVKEAVEGGEADEETIAKAKSECREEIKAAVGEVKDRIREEIKEKRGKRILEMKEKVKEESSAEETELEAEEIESEESAEEE